MKVYFLRHGPAVARGEWTRDDAERPLTDQGVARMERIATTLAGLDLGLGAIVSSPFVRASRTAEIVARTLNVDWSGDARLAPGFDAELLRAILLEHPGVDAIMLVGHEPDLGGTIGALVGGGRITCRKGGLALVNLPGARSRAGELAWLVPPRILEFGRQGPDSR